MEPDLTLKLQEFRNSHGFNGKGALCVALVITEHGRKRGLPLDPDELITEGGGQVLGLGKGAVQKILRRNGITRVLASEGGRTSRGSAGNMRHYVSFLNALEADGIMDLDQIEAYWIQQVHEFFAGKPFKLKMDASRSLRHIMRHLIDQAIERQRKSQGVYFAGALLQHLVGAKLDRALPEMVIEHFSFSTADGPTAHPGDFYLGDVAIHVTISPSEAVIAKCRDNIDQGHRAILITLPRKVDAAETLAENAQVADRLDIFEIEQFLALNLYELGNFASAGRRVALEDIIRRYNEIVEAKETDPSLKIEMT